MAGRFEGTLNGRPVVIEADGTEIELIASSVYSLWSSRRSLSYGTFPFLQQLQVAGFALTINVGSYLKLEVLPQPHWMIRWFVPGLQEKSYD